MPCRELLLSKPAEWKGCVPERAQTGSPYSHIPSPPWPPPFGHPLTHTTTPTTTSPPPLLLPLLTPGRQGQLAELCQTD